MIRLAALAVLALACTAAGATEPSWNGRFLLGRAEPVRTRKPPA